MDHRWDERVRNQRAGHAERDRYGAPRIVRDEDVERRDRLVATERIPSFSPWSIGASHWDQRDTYTRDSRVDDAGYARGPSVHPEVGSYAYHRDVPSRSQSEHEEQSLIYEREAWPWLQYHDAPRQRNEEAPLWSRVKERLAHLTQFASHRPAQSHAGVGPKNWNRSPARIHEEVCEALTFHGELDATDIEVDVEGNEVTLRGTVPDRASKRLAARIAEGVHGVEDVHNELKIRRHDDTNDADVAFVMPARAFG